MVGGFNRPKPAELDFYFDFSSPYAYLAALRIDAVAARHGREARWRPFMLGAAFKNTGQRPLLEQPMRGDYARHDWLRAARSMGVPFVLPEGFPFAALAASRVFYWLADQDGVKARLFARRIFLAAFGEGRNMTRIEDVAGEVVAVGGDPGAAMKAAGDALWKQRLHQETEAALQRGVFGSPFIMVDGEPFWGNDRLDCVERWLDTGGW